MYLVTKKSSISSTMSSSPQTVFKVTLIGGPTRILSFPSRPTWHELIPRILSLFRIPNPAQAISLIYLDTEGDEITISSHEELSQYYDNIPPDQTLKLSFRLHTIQVISDHQGFEGDNDMSLQCPCGPFSISDFDGSLSPPSCARCGRNIPFNDDECSDPCPPGRSNSSYPYHLYDPPPGFYDYPHGTWSDQGHSWNEGNQQDDGSHYRSCPYGHDMMDEANDERIIAHVPPPPADRASGVRQLMAGMEDMTLT
jgi:hypothetical protein